MKPLLSVFGLTLFIATWNAHAANPIDMAIEKLQKDVAKMNMDMENHAGRAILHADKDQIKSDRTALKAARRIAKNRKDLY